MFLCFPSSECSSAPVKLVSLWNQASFVLSKKILIYEAPHFRTKYSNLDRMKLETLLDCQVGKWRAIATRSSEGEGMNSQKQKTLNDANQPTAKVKQYNQFLFWRDPKISLAWKTSLSTRVILFLFISGNSMRCRSHKQTVTEPNKYNCNFSE